MCNFGVGDVSFWCCRLLGLREGFLKPLARAMARGGGLIALRLGSLMVVFELPWGSDGSGAC